MPFHKIKSFHSNYFELYCLHEGIYAAIADCQGPTGSNAGFFDLGEFTIVFDTFLHIEATRDLLIAVQQFTDGNIKLVINSHDHLDHFVGNCLIPSSIPIIATEYSKKSIEQDSPNDFKELAEISVDEIRELEKQLAYPENYRAMVSADNSLRFYKAFQFPEITLRCPDVGFSNRITISGTKNNVELINVGLAHTPGDLVAYFPEQKILFCGDLLFSNRFPYIGAGDPLQLNKLMNQYLEQDIQIFVPGHGNIGGELEVQLQIQYIDELYDIVSKRKLQGILNQDITRENFSTVFHQWEGPSFWGNYEFVVNQLSQNLKE